MKDSFQEGMQESGVGRTRKAQVTEATAATVNSPEATEAYFY